MIFIIGGLNTDITGAPRDGALVLHDSNISRIRLSIGGVGRNIAENLLHLGHRVELVAPLGSDYFANMQEKACETLGIGLHYAPRFEGPGGVYLCINDLGGDMFIAMNDMEICKKLRPEHLPMEAINRSDACVVDANLPEDCIRYLGEHVQVPLFADPVSIPKAEKLRPILKRLKAFKPNAIEAASLSGKEEPLQAARALVDMGVEQVYVSLGEKGMAYAHRNGKSGLCPPVPARVINTTGAGDSATAAICSGVLRGLPIEKTAALACRAASLTIESPDAVDPRLSTLKNSF